MLDHLDLVAPPVAAALASWPRGRTGSAVVAIDPDLADTAAMTAEYDLPLAASGNCVVVLGASRRRGAHRRLRRPRRHPCRRQQRGSKAARRPQGDLPRGRDDAVEGTGMEYGGITPGRASRTGWRVLVDARRGRARGHPGLGRTTLEAAGCPAAPWLAAGRRGGAGPRGHGVGVVAVQAGRDPRAARPRGVVLVLHGGAGRGSRRVSPAQLSVLRMVPVAGRIARAGTGRLAVYRLLNSHRGWDSRRRP